LVVRPSRGLPHSAASLSDSCGTQRLKGRREEVPVRHTYVTCRGALAGFQQGSSEEKCRCATQQNFVSRECPSCAARSQSITRIRTGVRCTRLSGIFFSPSPFRVCVRRPLRLKTVAKTTCKSMQERAQSRAGAFFFAMGKQFSKPLQFFVIHLYLLIALRAARLLPRWYLWKTALGTNRRWP
jgi:hypothetical protein